MSKKDCLRDGMKIYDTPYIGGKKAVRPGFNCFPCTTPEGSKYRLTAYFERQLYIELVSVLDWEVPSWWDKDFFLWCLYRIGFVGIINTPKYGTIPQPCTAGAERTVFYQPSKIMVSNPLIRKVEYKLGEDAALLKLCPDYFGAWDLIHEYAEMLACIWQSSKMNVLNTRLAWFLASTNKASSETLKKIIEAIDEGDSAIIVDAALFNDKADTKGDGTPWQEFKNDVDKYYINDKLVDDFESVLDSFKREIGIPVMSDKKERMLTNEVEAETQYSLTKIDVWMDTLERTLENVFEVFPDLRGKLSVKIHDAYEGRC